MPIDLSILPVFLAAVFALLIVPGPDFILITSQAATRGVRFGIACSLGIAASGAIQTGLVAFGLGHLMETWPVIALIVRILGAIYLALLGINMLREWWRGRRSEIPKVAISIENSAASRMFWTGLLSNLLNPKALLFFSVFIPQFVSAHGTAASSQIAFLGGLLTAIALAYNLMLSVLAGVLRHSGFKLGLFSRHGAGLVGGIFLFLAGRLVFTRGS